MLLQKTQIITITLKQKLCIIFGCSWGHSWHGTWRVPFFSHSWNDCVTTWLHDRAAIAYFNSFWADWMPLVELLSCSVLLVSIWWFAVCIVIIIGAPLGLQPRVSRWVYWSVAHERGRSMPFVQVRLVVLVQNVFQGLSSLPCTYAASREAFPLTALACCGLLFFKIWIFAKFASYASLFY